MSAQRAIRAGDRVKHRYISAQGTVLQMIRADQYYHRRAVVRWDSGREETLAASALVLVAVPA
jgi:hypothetical protein